jgi:hypothetical protein
VLARLAVFAFRALVATLIHGALLALLVHRPLLALVVRLRGLTAGSGAGCLLE